MEPIKVFLDTNIVIDYLSGRMSDGKAETIMQIGQSPYYQICISFLTAVNTMYVCHKYGVACSPKELADLFKILPQDLAQWMQAGRLSMKDFEDALQTSCALESHCDMIITRDDHYMDAPMAVYSPEEFIRLATR